MKQVLLSSMWYVTSCWIVVKWAIAQIQRLMRDLLWSGGDRRFAHTKVACSTITRPKERGGLGVIDLECRSKAL